MPRAPLPESLPNDTRQILRNLAFAGYDNPSLWYQRYAPYTKDTMKGWGLWRDGRRGPEATKGDWLSARPIFSAGILHDYLHRYAARLLAYERAGYELRLFEAVTDWRLIVGLGEESVLETGITLHRLCGFPYLPATALKGLAHVVAAPEKEDENKPEVLIAFGSLDRQGQVIFFDALPRAEQASLEMDVMTPHYSEYYGGGKPPADYLNPVPIPFLTVPANCGFVFALAAHQASDLLTQATAWLKEGLEQWGIGAKTSAGYGYFKTFYDRETNWLKSLAVPQAQATSENPMIQITASRTEVAADARGNFSQLLATQEAARQAQADERKRRKQQEKEAKRRRQQAHDELRNRYSKP